MPSTELEQAVMGHGISRKTFERAKSELDLEKSQRDRCHYVRLKAAPTSVVECAQSETSIHDAA
jgi:hypothetical protein